MPRTIKAPAVTEKNTKQEILSVYRSLLEEAASTTQTESAENRQDREVVENASRETVEKVTNDLSKLKVVLNQTIAGLLEQLSSEAEKLAGIRKAIVIAQKDIEETQKIKVTAGLLYRMVELQKEREEAFEKDIREKRKAWEEEQAAYELERKRERERGEEEYTYEKALQKKRDEDEREEARRIKVREEALEKEAKMQTLKELEELRKKVFAFPIEKDKAIKEALGRALADAKRDSDVRAQLAKQQADAALNLSETRNLQLAETVKVQASEIVRLNRELAEATRQVKDIAVSIVEGQRKEPTSQVRSNQDTAK